MPIIASHHNPAHPLASDTGYRPEKTWPDDCKVQWGGQGLVVGKSNYTTAFFEAFPGSGGFIRGEGETIEAAEAQAHERFLRESVCTHRWGRRGYTNSGGKCIRCGAFKSGMFKEIVKLGGWRKPLTLLEWSPVLSGWLRDRSDASRNNERLRRHNRKTWLRCRYLGIKLPDMAQEPMTDDQFMGQADDPYRVACREAVAEWLESDRCQLPEEERARIWRQIEMDRVYDARRRERQAEADRNSLDE